MPTKIGRITIHLVEADEVQGITVVDIDLITNSCRIATTQTTSICDPVAEVAYLSEHLVHVNPDLSPFV